MQLFKGKNIDIESNVSKNPIKQKRDYTRSTISPSHKNVSPIRGLPLCQKGCQMGGFGWVGWVINGLDLKKPIAHLGPFNKICIVHIQCNPPIYPIILRM